MVKGPAQFNSAAGMFGVGECLDVNAMRPFIDDQGRSCIVRNGQRFVTNAPALLRYDEWKDIDRTVIQVATDRLVGIADLISRGLTHSLGSIGLTISLWERESSMTPANISMSGVTEGEEDTPEYDYQQVPVPVVHKDFRVNIRRLEASRRFGESIDVTAAAMAGRAVSEASEDMLFSGYPIKVDGATIYGYTTHPDRAQVNMSAKWDDPSTTGEDIVKDVQAMLDKARENRYFGPFVMYVPGGYEGLLDNDYNPQTSDTRTIRQRIMQLTGIAEIRVADRLPPHNVLLVQLTRDVVDMAIARDITTVQWSVNGGMQERFKVMAVWVPRIKSTYDGQSGIVHLYEIE